MRGPKFSPGDTVWFGTITGGVVGAKVEAVITNPEELSIDYPKYPKYYLSGGFSLKREAELFTTFDDAVADKH